MVLPKLKKCCGCVPLEAGGVVITVISLLACVAALAFCATQLAQHQHQQNEDNIILLSMTMFATLSAVSNLVGLVGILLKRPSYLQITLLSNAVFFLCILMVAATTCLFSPRARPLLAPPGAARGQTAGRVVAAVLLLLAAAVYSLYYLTIINSVYTKMKLSFGNSAIPYHV